MVASLNPEKNDLGKMDADSLWHAMVQHKPFSQKPPKCMKHGVGCYVTDADGVEYFDGISGLWCVNVGYGR